MPEDYRTAQDLIKDEIRAQNARSRRAVGLGTLTSSPIHQGFQLAPALNDMTMETIGEAVNRGQAIYDAIPTETKEMVLRRMDEYNQAQGQPTGFQMEQEYLQQNMFPQPAEPAVSPQEYLQQAQQELLLKQQLQNEMAYDPKTRRQIIEREARAGAYEDIEVGAESRRIPSEQPVLMDVANALYSRIPGSVPIAPVPGSPSSRPAPPESPMEERQMEETGIGPYLKFNLFERDIYAPLLQRLMKRRQEAKTPPPTLGPKMPTEGPASPPPRPRFPVFGN